MGDPGAAEALLGFEDHEAHPMALGSEVIGGANAGDPAPMIATSKCWDVSEFASAAGAVCVIASSRRGLGALACVGQISFWRIRDHV